MAHISLRRKKQVMVSLLVIAILASYWVLKSTESYQHITLQSTWQSEETEQVLSFTSEGEVQFAGNLPSGTYYIISPNRMEYTINGQTFKMFYRIEDDQLFWGLSDEMLETYRWMGK